LYTVSGPVRFLFATVVQLALMQLYVFACELLQHRSYPDFERKLRELKAVPLMHSIWAVGTRLSAVELNAPSGPWLGNMIASW
jgi:hypothetical protein